MSIKRFPNGVIVKQMSTANWYLILGDSLYRWSFDGYGDAQPIANISGPFVVLTPACTIKALQHGYNMEIHPSAAVCFPTHQA